MKIQKVIICFLLFTFIPIVFIQANNLSYKDRGNRFEGVKPKPISGEPDPKFELISAIVNYEEKTEIMPKTLKLKFYLNELSSVYITVREKEYKYNYWMDKIKSENPWSKGFNNTFSWSSQTVLKYLKRLEMYDLGILIRLYKSYPSENEKIAPVIFYHQNYPMNIIGYLFTLKTNRISQVEYYIYKDESNIPIESKIIPRQSGSRPFTIEWLSKSELDGLYKIIINGRVLSNNKTFYKIISFYHKSIIN